MTKFPLSRFALFIGAACGAFILGFGSANLQGYDEQRFDKQVRGDFFAGLAGNTEALDRGMRKTEAILEANPKHAEAMVWHGAGLYMRGVSFIQSGEQAKGMENMNKGIAEMTQAVALEPDNIGVRAPRGAVLLQASRFVPVPAIARLYLADGVSDYEHIYKLQASHFDQLGVHPRGELLFGLAEGLSRAGNEQRAAELFEKIRKDLPGTPYATRAAKWLQTKSLSASETRCVGCHVQ